MNYIKEIIKYLIVIGVILYVIGGLVTYFNQHKEIYFPDEQDFDSCIAFSDAEKVKVSGTRLYFKWNSNKLIIYYHANTGSACDEDFLKEIFEEINYSYIFVEYAGYAGDSRRPSKKYILQDVRNTNNFIKTLNYSELIIGGYSLGTGLASYHSTLTKADKIFLVSAYTSIADLAKQRTSIYPLSLLLTENYDNELYLQNYKEGLMVIHGGNDLVIPIELAKRLFNSVPTENKEFVEVKEAGHGDIFDYDETIDRIKGFIKK